MAKHTSSAGSVSVDVVANLQPLKDGLQQGKQLAQQGAREMSAATNVNISGVADLGLAQPEQQAQTQKNVKTRLAAAFARHKRNTQSQIEASAVRYEIAQQGFDPNQILGVDKREAVFQREMTREMTAERKATRTRRLEKQERLTTERYAEMESLQRAREPMSDAQRMRGGEDAITPVAGAAGTFAKLASVVKWTAVVTAAKQVANVLIDLRQMDVGFNLVSSRLQNFRIDARTSGFKGEARALTADIRAGELQLNADKAAYWASRPLIGGLIDWGNDYAQTRTAHAAKVAGEEAAAEHGALPFIAQGRITARTYQNGNLLDRVGALRAAQQESERKYEADNFGMLHLPNVKAGMVALRESNRQERLFAETKENTEIRGLEASANMAGLDRFATEAQLSGDPRALLIANLARKRVEITTRAKNEMDSAEDTQKPFIQHREAKELRSLAMEARLGARDLMINPGQSIVQRASESYGGFYERYKNLDKETNTILEKILEAINANGSIN